ncbi:glycosyltransferase [bacterium]|nr:MAG: glycosyltransferase [bacterium]
MNKSQDPLVSIIVIDYKKNNPYLIECLEAIECQTYKNFEIILETDHSLDLKYPKLTIVNYGGKYIPPANKRDHGAKMAKGEILAFIDDDAYPDPHWLENTVPHFKNKTIAGVGGPGITPPGVSWQEAASGWASASPMGAGLYNYRFFHKKKQFVDDYPSMNLSVRKADFEAVGGYDSNFWPGEDTKLCLDLTLKLNKKIIYDPKAVVFHHRRPLWGPHLKQNGSFGLHRGFFARILPATSFRPIYFLPSLMLLGAVFIVISSCLSFPLFLFLRTLGLYAFTIYFIALFINAIWILNRSKSFLQSLISIPTIFVTHLWYGAKFIQGYLFTAKLKR